MSSLAELRKWSCRHTGQRITFICRGSDNVDTAVDGTLGTDANGTIVVIGAAGQMVPFPDPNLDYAQVTAHADARRPTSVFGGGAAVMSRPPSPVQPAQAVSPSPVNPMNPQSHATAQDLQQLTAMVAQLVSAQHNQSQAISALAHSMSQARPSLSPPQESPASTTSSNDTAAVLSHLRELEQEKKSTFNSKDISPEHAPQFSPAEIHALKQLPVTFFLHKKEKFFADYVYAVQRMAEFIINVLCSAFTAKRPVAAEVHTFFAEACRRERISLSVERAARLRSSAAALDVAISTRSDSGAQEAFLDLALLHLLLDKDLALSYPRLVLCCIAATPTAADTADTALAGKSNIRMAKPMTALPVKAGAGAAGF